jgi:hypothetical protein
MTTSTGGRDDNMRRLRRLQDDPAWIADETDPRTRAAIDRIRLASDTPGMKPARAIPALFRVMVALLTLGLAGATALGFGAPVPQWAVLAAIGGGTAAMVALFACLIGLKGMPLARRG